MISSQSSSYDSFRDKVYLNILTSNKVKVMLPLMNGKINIQLYLLHTAWSRDDFRDDPPPGELPVIEINSLAQREAKTITISPFACQQSSFLMRGMGTLLQSFADGPYRRRAEMMDVCISSGAFFLMSS